MAEKAFRYDFACQRNRGWFREEDQGRLRSKRIAIPGLGGVGGHHLHGFLRLGFEKFNLADPATFEIKNFNRQQGASCETIGQLKIDVAPKFARSINPDVDLRLFPQGVTEANMDEFLDGVDIGFFNLLSKYSTGMGTDTTAKEIQCKNEISILKKVYILQNAKAL